MNTTEFKDLSTEEYKKRTISHWTKSPCGSNYSDKDFLTRDYFAEIRSHRYGSHPWILRNIESFDIKQKKVLEIGYGMGTDHLSLAKQGAITFGIDLTFGNSQVASRAFELEGQSARLIIGDAEQLPYDDNSFDFVYSFGVIHHSPDTQKIISEIHRVLRPGGRCWITVYHKNSIFFWWTVLCWSHFIRGGYKRYNMKQELSLIEHPNDNPDMVVRLYTKSEFLRLFERFGESSAMIDHLVPANIAPLSALMRDGERPTAFFNWLGKRWGWYVVVSAQK